VDRQDVRLTTTDALGHATHTAYDADGNLTSQTNATQRVTTYSYDGLNRRTSSADPLHRTTTFDYVYDATGDRVTATDAAGGSPPRNMMPSIG
jgi:YD repeat-containing protein